jgi:hypothetical protein
VKPTAQFEKERFPCTDCFFQAFDARWHGYWPGDDDQSRRRNLGREYLIEAARERAKEMAVLGILLFAAAWPVVLMIVEVVRLYKGKR